MMNIHNAVSDTMDELGMTGRVESHVDQDPQNENRWLVTFQSPAGSLIHSKLHVEILQLGNDNVVGCVLERRNVGSSRMNRIMDTLMDFLDIPGLIPVHAAYPQPPPPAGSPFPQN